jgi:feruloyl esterase
LVAEALNPGNVKTWPDTNELSAFRTRGGKLISYHGQQDHQITSFNTARWYQHLLSDPSTTRDDLDFFLRVFRISGMFHCSAGPGAWVIGQGGDARTYSGVPFERSRNVLAAIIAWVEDGVPPETMTGTKFVDDDYTKGTAFQRRHCR